MYKIQDYRRHKAALAVEGHFLRRMSLARTASVYDRNGSYTHYPVPGDPQHVFFIFNLELHNSVSLC